MRVKEFLLFITQNTIFRSAFNIEGMKKVILSIACLWFVVGTAFSQEPSLDNVPSDIPIPNITPEPKGDSLPDASQLNPLSDYYVYCETEEKSQNLFGKAFYAFITFGASHGQLYLMNDDGTKMVFTDTLSVLNELSFRGWELADVYVIDKETVDKTYSKEKYLLKKRFSQLSEEERTAYGR